MIYNDPEFGKIEVETPEITNYLPAVGFLGGLFAGLLINRKRVDRVIACALIGTGIGLIPKLYYANKGVSDAIGKIREQEAKVDEEMVKNLDAPIPLTQSNDTGKDGEQNVHTEEILSLLDALADSNEESMAHWLPRREHFQNKIDLYGQTEKNVLHELIYVALLSPKDPNEAQMSKMLLDIEAIDKKFGNVVEKVQEDLDELCFILNNELEALPVSIAA